MCTLTVSQAQHCTVNNVQAGGGQHTKIKILFTSDKKSPPNRVQHLWDTYRNVIQRKTAWKKTWCSFPPLPTVSGLKLLGDRVDKCLYKFLILCIKDFLNFTSFFREQLITCSTKQQCSRVNDCSCESTYVLWGTVAPVVPEGGRSPVSPRPPSSISRIQQRCETNVNPVCNYIVMSNYWF